MGIGHVRYPTAGSASAQEAQPFFVNSPLGIYLIHNGNLTNVDALRHTLEDSQSFFNRHLRTESDSEVTPVCQTPGDTRDCRAKNEAASGITRQPAILNMRTSSVTVVTHRMVHGYKPLWRRPCF